MARLRARGLTGAALVAVAAAGVLLAWRQTQQPRLPDGFAVGNGRLEATEVVVASKRPGRIQQILVDEGDVVEKGQIVARIAADDLDAELRAAEAQVAVAREEHNQANAQVAEKETELGFIVKELGRTTTLSRRGLVAKQTFDQDEMRKRMAESALAAARAHRQRADASGSAAAAQVARVQADIADTVLTSPVAGRVLYRLAEPGEVLPAGGKLLTVIDLVDVYMTVFLPMRDAGRASLGAEARVVLDARPEFSLPATLSFVAPIAQFTPKEVETRNEREKLMFRAKVQIDPQYLDGHLGSVKTGLPGVAYIRIDASGEWPAPFVPPRVQ
jgi:HlyD family secretion protein